MAWRSHLSVCMVFVWTVVVTGRRISTVVKVVIVGGGVGVEAGVGVDIGRIAGGGEVIVVTATVIVIVIMTEGGSGGDPVKAGETAMATDN